MKSAVMNSRIARRDNGNLLCFCSPVVLACNVGSRAKGSVAPFKNHGSRWRGGSVGWNRVGSVARPGAETEGEGNQETPEHDRVGPNPEDHREGTRSREGEQEQPEHYRE